MIRNKINDKKYIGQAVDIDRRWRDHKSELDGNRHCNPHLQNSWNKYGADNFEFTIIHECDEELLDELEIMYIAHFDTYNNGYNLTLGGDGCRGYRYTDEQRARSSEAKKGKPKSEECKAKLSESRKEYYKDPENRKKHSEAMKEALNRPEVRAKMSESLKEYYKDPEVKKKRSEAMKGKNTGPKSEEWKAKVSEAMNRPEVKAKLSKKVYCVTNNTIYESLVEAGEKLGIDSGDIGWCCKGKNILLEYPDGHHKKKGLKKDSPIYEFWYLLEYEEKFGKAVM